MKEFTMNEVEELYKAIQETAKFGQVSAETARDAVGFLTKVFRSPIEELAGIATDTLRFIRWKKVVAMYHEANQILKDKGVTIICTIPPKLAIPIVENSSLEEDPDIRSLWSHLLANAMNPEFNSEIRYGFIDMLKGITAKEAQMLDSFYASLKKENGLRPLSRLNDWGIRKEEIIKDLSISEDEYAVSINNLMRMQLVASAVVKSGIAVSDRTRLTSYAGIDQVSMTALGVLFVEACMK